MTQSSPHRIVSQRNLLRCTAVGLVLALANVAYAAPGDATVPAGVGAAPSIAINGATTDVTLNQSRTLIDWSSFNIGKDETVNFRFNAGKDIVLNRVSGAANIDGALNGLVGNQVGGNVWVYSSQGVVFGANARVNVGGLLATTTPLFSDAEFLSGSGNLTFKGGLTDAGVAVKGGAKLTSAGGLALIAPSVATEAGATVNANGTVLYGAAQNFRIRFDASAGGGFDLIEFEVPTSALEDGTVSATPLTINGVTTGSNVMMAAVNRPSVMNALISIDGTVTARSASQGQGGEIILSSSGAPAKTTLGAGSLLDASSTGAGQAGGSVAVQSNIIEAYGAIDASGPAGGGSIKVGGGFQGKDASIANSEAVFIDAGATLKADAKASGNGGNVVVWSDRWTGFAGNISALGGALGGDGGQAEVSSKGWLGFQGLADLRAPKGAVGHLLLDPAEIRIVSGLGGGPLTANYTPGAGVTTTDIGTGTIFLQLALGDLTISTDMANTLGDGHIEIVNGLNYAGLVDSNILTLNAEAGFVFTDPAPISASGLGGFKVVLDAGTAAFNTGAAIINTRGSAGDGSISITGAGVAIGGALTSGAVSLTSTGGDITQTAAITASGAFVANAGADDIVLTGANKLAGTVATLTGSDISLTNDQALTVTGTGVTGVGDLALTTTTGGLTISGALTRAGSITLASVGALSADAVTASTGDLSLKGSGITFGGAVEATAGDVTLETTGGQLNLTQAVTTGATNAATLKSSADIAQTAAGIITAGTVTGNSAGGALLTEANAVGNLGAFTNTSGGAVELTSTLGLTVTGAVTNTTGGPGAINLQGVSVAVDAALDGGSVGLTATGGAITQSAIITTTAGFSAEATGGATTLTTSGNKIGGTIGALKGTTVSFTNDQATSVAAADITSGGALSLETTTGDLTVTGALSQAGTISLTSAGALSAAGVNATTGDVVMKGSTITFNGAVDSDAGSVSLEATGGALSLTQTVDAATTTTLKGQAGITQSAIITTSGLSADGDTGDVTLTGANKISGNVNGLAGGNVSLTNSQALTVIPNVTATGNIALTTTTGSLTVSGGALGVAGDLTLTAAGALNLDSGASSSAGNLSLKGTSLNFVNPGSLSASTGDVSIETTGSALTLDRNVTAGAAQLVTLKSSGVISQSAGVITGGTVTGSSVGGATLTQAGNDVSGIGPFTNTTSGAVALTTTNDLTVAGAVSNTPGAINLTGKSITVSNALTSGAGASSLTATDGSIAVNAATGAATLNLATTNGSITQTGVITTTTGFSADARGGTDGAVTLAAANKIGGAISNLSGTSVSFTNDQAANLSGAGVVNVTGVSGGLSLVTTTGNLTVGTVSAPGNVLLSAAGALIAPAADVTSTAGSVTIVSHNAALALGAVSAANATAGDVSINTNGQDLSFTSLVAGRDAALAGKAITTAGIVTVGRDYSISGETFSAGVFAPAGGVPRDYAITDTVGGFTGSGLSAVRNLTINATDVGNNAPISITGASTTTGNLTVNGSSIALAGAINVGARDLSLTANQGAISQSSGAITAGKVTASAVTGINLQQSGNAFTSLGAVSNTTSGDILLLTTTGLGLTDNVTAAGQLVQLVGAGGAVNQTGGVITGNQLNIGGGSVSAEGANVVNIVRIITTAGDGVVNNTQALRIDQSDAVGGNLKITTAGNISVNQVVSAGLAAGTQSVELIATGGGAITDTATGGVVGGVLKGSSGGGFVLDSANNNVGRLQDVTDVSATGISFVDGVGGVSVANLSAANGPITISTPGALVIDGTVTGSTSTASPTQFISTGGMVSQTSGGVITAGQVTGSAVTGFNLGVATNVVGELGAVSNTTSGGITFKTSAGLALPGAITAPGQTVTLNSPGPVTQGVGGVITAGTLTANGVGGLSFGGANQLGIASLTSTGAGNIVLTNAAATGLTVSASTTGDITLSNNGNLTLGNIVAGPVAGPQTASFTSVNGAIGQSGGTGITAGTVTGSAAGVLDLTTSTTNQVSHIGAFSTTGAIGAGLRSATPLSIDGVVSGGTGLAVFLAPGLTLSSTGSVTSGAASGVQLESTGAGNALTLQGVINTAGYVSLTSGGIINQTAGTISGASLGAVSVGGTTLGAVNAAALAGLSNTGSGDIVLTDSAVAVTSAAITNPVGKIIINTPNGSLAFTGAVQGSGDVALTSLTGLSGTAASSTGGALSLSGAGVNFTGAAAGSTSATINGNAGNVALGSLNSGTGDATVTGAGVSVTGAVNVGRDYLLTGTTFNAGALVPVFAAGTGRDFILTDTAGGLTFTNLSAPRDLIVSSTDAALGDSAQISGGGLNAATGKITVNGTRITLTGAVTAPAGDVTLTSTVGGIGLSGAVTAAANKVTLASAGTITESGSGAVTAARLSATATGGITMNGANKVVLVDNLTNSGAGGVSFRNTAATTTVTGVTTGSGDIDLRSTGAIILSNALTAPGALRIEAGGALSGVTTSAASTTLIGNGVALTSATSTGATTIQGGAGLVNIATVGAGGGALSVTGGPIQIATATAGTTATLTASSTINVTTLTAVGAANLEATGAFTGGTITSTTGDLTLKGSTLALTTGSAGRDAILTSTVGNMQIGDLTAVRNIGLTSAGDINANLISLGGDLTAQATGDLNLKNIVAAPTSALVLRGRDIVLGAPTGATPGVGDVLAGGSLDIVATRDALINVSGPASLSALKGGRDVKLSTLNGDISLGAVEAGNTIVINAQNASATVGAVTLGASGVSASITATNDAVLGALAGATPTAGQVLSAPATATLAVNGGRDAVVNVAGAAKIDTLTAGRDALGSAAAGDLTTTTVTAGRNAQLTAAAGAVNATTVIATSGNAGLVGRAVTLGTGTAGGNIDARATTQSVRVTSATAGGDITVRADAGAASLKTARLTGAIAGVHDITVTAATTATLGRLPGEAAPTAAGAVTLDDPARARVTVKGAIATVDLTGAADLTRVEATGGDVTVKATGPITVAANGAAPTGLVSSGAVIVSSTGNVTLNTVSANGAADLQSGAALTAATVQSGAGGLIAKGVTVNLGDAQTTGVASVTAANGVTVTTRLRGATGATIAGGAGVVNAALVDAGAGALTVTGGSIQLGSALAGGAVNLTAATGGLTSGKTTGTTIIATATAGPVTLTQTSGSTVTVNAAAGSASLTGTAATGALAVTGQAVTVAGGTQGAGIALTSTAGAITANDAVNATGDLILKATGGGATVGGVAAATGKAQVFSTGLVSINSLTGDTVMLRGSDLALSGGLRAAKVCAPTCADATLVIESAQGGLNLGDATSADPFPTAPMTISKAEYALVRGDAVTLYAGDTTNAARRGDVRIGDLALDIARTDTLTVLAGPANAVQVTGAVAPGAGGGGNLVIGAADAASGWTPKVVYVTGGGGSLGTGVVSNDLAAQKPLKSVTLNAVDDVLLGSDAFIAAINQARAANAVNSINIIRNTPQGVQAKPADLNRVFLTADTMTLRANGVIVQQNTSFTGNQSGIVLTNRGDAPVLASFGRTGATPATGVTPLLIDLSLAYFNATGALIGKQVVAASPTISLGTLSRTDAYRINGCAIGVGGSCTPLPNTLVDISIGKLVEGVQLTTQDAPQAYDPTITGAGNEEIWRNNECNRDDNQCR